MSCKAGDSVATTKINVLIDALDNGGTVTPQQQDVLKGPPGQGDAQWQFLYPYDQTSFPKGILAQHDLTAGSSPGSVFYLHIVAPLYEYEGYFNVAANGTQLQMSQSAWTPSPTSRPTRACRCRSPSLQWTEGRADLPHLEARRRQAPRDDSTTTPTTLRSPSKTGR